MLDPRRLPSRPAARPDPIGFCGTELDRLDSLGLLRRVRPLASGSEPEVVLEGHRVLCLASNNYLGLATHPDVTAAAAQAAAQWGAGAGAARLITGGLGIHDALEAEIAA